MQEFHQKIQGINIDVTIDSNDRNVEYTIMGLLYSMCSSIASGTICEYNQKQIEVNEHLLKLMGGGQ